jgi:glycosidase
VVSVGRIVVLIGVLAAALTGCGSPLRRSAAGCDRVGATALPVDARPWWTQAVFYEIFVRSFADAAAGPLADDGIGDLRGLIDRLDYLNDGDPSTAHDLGVTALWLMPVTESPSYHGYDVVDYHRVEQDYGTNADLCELVDESHRRGVRVILDLVLNHTSSRHPWFRDAYRAGSPYRDWYLWSTERRTYRGPWGQQVWHQLPWWQRGWRHFAANKYYGLFWSGMPDLDHTNPEVRRAVFDIARFWLDEVGVDGFRLDAVRHLIEDGPVQEDTAATHEWLRSFAAHCRSIAPDCILVGEVWDATEIVATYGPDEVDLCFEFDLAGAILEAVRLGEAAPVVAAHAAVSSSYPDNGFAAFLSNHDQNRVMWHVDGDPDRARLAATLLLLGPGVPFLYYGEEIGMTGHKPDPEIRTPMQWSADRHAGFSRHRPWQQPQPSYTEVNVAAQHDDPGSLLSAYRRLIRLRGRHEALVDGGLEVVSTGDDRVHAFLRSGDEERILVVANLGDEAVGRVDLDPVVVPEPATDLLTGSEWHARSGLGPHAVVAVGLGQTDAS